MKSPNNERDIQQDRERRIKEQNREEERNHEQEREHEVTLLKENRLAESGEGLDIDSRFQLQDQPSRISIVSR